mgnify:CR=1 FL=1
MFLGRNPSRTSKHHNVSCWFGSNLCRSKAEPPDNKNGCLGVLCRPFCLQLRYYGLPSLLKFDGPKFPGANYEKYDFSENRKVQNPPGWWVFLLTENIFGDHFLPFATIPKDAILGISFCLLHYPQDFPPIGQTFQSRSISRR